MACSRVNFTVYSCLVTPFPVSSCENKDGANKIFYPVIFISLNAHADSVSRSSIPLSEIFSHRRDYVRATSSVRTVLLHHCTTLDTMLKTKQSPGFLYVDPQSVVMNGPGLISRSRISIFATISMNVLKLIQPLMQWVSRNILER